MMNMNMPMNMMNMPMNIPAFLPPPPPPSSSEQINPRWRWNPERDLALVDLAVRANVWKAKYGTTVEAWTDVCNQLSVHPSAAPLRNVVPSSRTAQIRYSELLEKHRSAKLAALAAGEPFVLATRLDELLTQADEHTLASKLLPSRRRSRSQPRTPHSAQSFDSGNESDASLDPDMHSMLFQSMPNLPLIPPAHSDSNMSTDHSHMLHQHPAQLHTEQHIPSFTPTRPSNISHSSTSPLPFPSEDQEPPAKRQQIAHPTATYPSSANLAVFHRRPAHVMSRSSGDHGQLAQLIAQNNRLIEIQEASNKLFEERENRRLSRVDQQISTLMSVRDDIRQVYDKMIVMQMRRDDPQLMYHGESHGESRSDFNHQ